MAMTNCEASAPPSPAVCALILNSSGPLGSFLFCPCATTGNAAQTTIASTTRIERFSTLTYVEWLLGPTRWAPGRIVNPHGDEVRSSVCAPAQQPRREHQESGQPSHGIVRRFLSGPPR